MKPILQSVEAARRLARGQLGTRERIVDAVQRFIERLTRRRRPAYKPIPDDHFYTPPQRDWWLGR